MRVGKLLVGVLLLVVIASSCAYEQDLLWRRVPPRYPAPRGASMALVHLEAPGEHGAEMAQQLKFTLLRAFQGSDLPLIDRTGAWRGQVRWDSGAEAGSPGPTLVLAGDFAEPYLMTVQVLRQPRLTGDRTPGEGKLEVRALVWTRDAVLLRSTRLLVDSRVESNDAPTARVYRAPDQAAKEQCSLTTCLDDEPFFRDPVHSLSYRDAFFSGSARGAAEALARDYRSSRVRELVSWDKGGREVARGAELADDGHLDQAGQAWRRVLEVDPDNAAANYNLGLLQWISGDLSAASELLKKALELRDDALARSVLAGIRREEEQREALPVPKGWSPGAGPIEGADTVWAAQVEPVPQPPEPPVSEEEWSFALAKGLRSGVTLDKAWYSGIASCYQSAPDRGFFICGEVIAGAQGEVFLFDILSETGWRFPLGSRFSLDLAEGFSLLEPLVFLGTGLATVFTFDNLYDDYFDANLPLFPMRLFSTLKFNWTPLLDSHLALNTQVFIRFNQLSVLGNGFEMVIPGGLEAGLGLELVF